MAVTGISKKTLDFLGDLIAQGSDDEYLRNSLMVSYPDLDKETVAKYIGIARRIASTKEVDTGRTAAHMDMKYKQPSREFSRWNKFTQWATNKKP